MQFDVFDKKVKKAADHHHPAYDEQAWARMEKLLNTHLPQKEGRRRFLFWFLLFAGLGGAGLIAIRPWKSNQPITAVPKQPSSEPAAPSSLTPGSREADNKFPAGPDKRLITPAENHPNNNSNRMVFSDRSKHSNNRIPASATITTGNGYPLQPAGKLIAPQDNDPGPKQTTQPSGKTNPAPVLATEKEGQSPPGIAGNPPLSTAKDLVNKPQQPGLLNGKSEVVTQKNKEKPKKKAAKSSSFFFTLSAGPDISFVSKNKPGNTELLAGAGLGFSFNKRFTIRTGFYSGRKVYTAAPEAYHPPAAFYAYYPYLEKVDANCKVYEIPLSLSYNFSGSGRHNFFATAGVSSYLMKSETYDYSYKYIPGGQTLTGNWSVKNENQHYFSSVTLAAGYQRTLSKNISVMVEPYIKLPVSGVGYGRVKLNSGGVLFSIGVKPFNSKK